MYKNTKPFIEKFLKVDDIHTIYYEVSGNPNGIPVLYVHGGPGAGTTPKAREFFDPEYYKIILFDQRGCGKSTPSAEIKNNTTQLLINDIETIRKELKIDKFILFGGSWGSTLSLLYAINYPQHVLKMVLRGIFLCRKYDLDYLYEGGIEKFFPEYVEKYNLFIKNTNGENNIEKYYKLMTKGSFAEQVNAAKHFSSLEDIALKLIPEVSRSSDKDILEISKIEAHYFYNKIFLKDDNFILNNIDIIKNIPTYVVHGRFDNVCLPSAAYDLYKANPNINLKFVSAAHSAFEPAIFKELFEIMEKLKEAK